MGGIRAGVGPGFIWGVLGLERGVDMFQDVVEAMCVCVGVFGDMLEFIKIWVFSTRAVTMCVCGGGRRVVVVC